MEVEYLCLIILPVLLSYIVAYLSSDNTSVWFICSLPWKQFAKESRFDWVCITSSYNIKYKIPIVWEQLMCQLECLLLMRRGLNFEDNIVCFVGIWCLSGCMSDLYILPNEISIARESMPMNTRDIGVIDIHFDKTVADDPKSWNGKIIFVPKARYQRCHTDIVKE